MWICLVWRAWINKINFNIILKQSFKTRISYRSLKVPMREQDCLKPVSIRKVAPKSKLALQGIQNSALLTERESLHSKKQTLVLGDISCWFNVLKNDLLASKWKLDFDLIFHTTANSCQLIVQLDMDISIRFKMMLFWVCGQCLQHFPTALVTCGVAIIDKVAILTFFRSDYYAKFIGLTSSWSASFLHMLYSSYRLPFIPAFSFTSKHLEHNQT